MKRIIIAALIALATASVAADLGKQQIVVPETDQQKSERLKWWKEARFGMFIHWGPVSLKGTEIGWSRGGERRGVGNTGEIPVDVYDNLYKVFNPTKYNANEWVAIAKAAGMKYMVFTTRHHDGFSEWDTKMSDYNIMYSPYGKDIVKQYAEACHKAGMKLGFYYSQPDWRNSDYLTPTHSKFLEYMKGQLRELCTNYGKVDIIWFDGLQGNADTWDSVNTIAMIRSLQPGIIINNRAGLPEDFDTPEQSIGGFQNTRPWETCMTICQQWAYKPNDNMKSLQECLQTLIRCAGGDGNLLFNVGPLPTGEIEPRQVERLKEMGAWLKKYGESIYGTRGGPFKPNGMIASTRKADSIYVHIMNPGAGSLSLPAIPQKIKSAKLLTGGKVTFKQTAEGITLDIPKEYCRDIDTIVKLKLAGSAMSIPAIDAVKPSLKLPDGTIVKASNIYRDSNEFDPHAAFDGNPNTRWATDGGVKQAWIQMEYPHETTISSIEISEEFDRTQAFELQYLDGTEWKTFYKGSTIGKDFKSQFTPVKAKTFRLNILDATDGPTFWHIKLR